VCGGAAPSPAQVFYWPKTASGLATFDKNILYLALFPPSSGPMVIYTLLLNHLEIHHLIFMVTTTHRALIRAAYIFKRLHVFFLKKAMRMHTYSHKEEIFN
jgi:hypothetical protein